MDENDESDEKELRGQLCQRIEDRQVSISNYLRRARPRRTLLSNISIFGSALVAVLTAGPGIGKKGFTDGVANLLSLPDSAVVWQVICLLSAVLSVAAATTTKLASSGAVAEHITAAETSKAELEGLLAALIYGHLPLAEAAQRYQQSLAKSAFVDEVPTKRRISGHRLVVR